MENKFQKLSIQRNNIPDKENVVSPLLNKLKGQLSDCCKSYMKLSYGNILENYKDFIDLHEKSNQLEKTIHKLSFYYNIPKCDEKKTVMPDGCQIMNIDFFGAHGSIIRCTMKQLLPHRITLDYSTGKQRYSYNRERLANSYRCDLHTFFSDHSIQSITDLKPPVLIWFRCIFPYGEAVVDADNLDPKVFIDTCVNKIMVADDNLKNVHYMITGEECESATEPYTIAYIGNNQEIYKLIAEAEL